MKRAAVAVLAVTFVLTALRYLRPSRFESLFGARPHTSELKELMAALANEQTRHVEGRLTGGFKYAPVASPQRGTDSDVLSPDVRIAAATIEKRARAQDTRQNRAALGVAHLVLGQFDEAVELLESCVQEDAANASLLSDLSVAYLARAKARHRVVDWASALATAARAIRLNRGTTEAHFNRALALEGLHLREEAVDAWKAYQSVDRRTSWSTESAAHIEALSRQQAHQSTGAAPPPKDNQVLREQIEDQLLGDWGSAVIGGDQERARTILDGTQTLAEQLVSQGGDGAAKDEIERIRRAKRSRAESTIREFALGHVSYAAARKAYVADNQQRAAELMEEASLHFERVGSSYRHWSPIIHAIVLRNKGANEAALDRLRHVAIGQLPSNYYHLRGRIAWAEGVARNALGRIDLGREQLKIAVAQFQTAGESDNLVATQTILAEYHLYLGDRASAWAQLSAVLERIGAAGSSRRNYHLLIAALLALSEDLPEAALEFQNARIRLATTPRFQTEAYLYRARTLAILGDDHAALADLARADEAVARLDDENLRKRNAADIRTAKAELLSRADCRQAIDYATEALDYVEHADPAVRLAGLLAIRAKCRQSLGQIQEARADLLSAVRAFESKRSAFVSASDRVQAFEQERAAFKDLVALEASEFGDWAAALKAAERERAGGQLEKWAAPGTVFDPTSAHRDLRPNVAVVYFESLTDRVLVWVLMRERWEHFERPIGRARLANAIARMLYVVRGGINLSGLRPYSEEIFEQLIRPALRIADGKENVVIVPDGPLFSVPFGALPDEADRPLLASRVVAVAPSLTAFLAASARLAGFTADAVLAVGDGHDAATTGLPRLPYADQEATEVGKLYSESVVLRGSAATKRRFFNEARTVIHFAGHTVVNRDFPMFSSMLVAPDPEDSDPGLVMESEITGLRFEPTRVVVLATCDSAAGRSIDGEGVISMARAFWAAGVPAVVASLWPVRDDLIDLATTFHRELRSQRDAARALRTAQLRVFESRGGQSPVSAWAGFLMFGGLTPQD
jgi:CHAT domain-containing protein/tetratricopeptide (TPR) repeat protein